MRVDLSAIIKIAGAKISLDDDIGLSDARFLGQTYSFKEPLKINGEIFNNGQSLTLKAKVTGKMRTECARCLKPIDVDVDFDIHELLSQAEDGADEDDDVILFEGCEIELDDIVADHFLMNISGRYLCKEDCKGLCPKCGHDLNDGDCGCDREDMDPRWQALADILDRQRDENPD